MGVREGIDLERLDETGWAVIFADNADPGIKEALGELLELRSAQAGPYFRIYDGRDGFRPGESKVGFLARHGMGPGPADPERVPYYLLIVGDPETIPFHFQFQLDIQYAVGRIYFDRVEDYARYAHSVAMAGLDETDVLRHAAFFSVQNKSDPHTQLVSDLLAVPLVDYLARRYPEWKLQLILGSDARKDRLIDLLTGDESPCMLLMVGHGVSFPPGDVRQIAHQGALLCAEWPGPQEWSLGTPIPPHFYLSGDDVTESMRLQGKIVMQISSFSAGTPVNDWFAQQAFKRREPNAPRPFVAGLAAAMLAHGALAYVGLADSAWGFAFRWRGAETQRSVLGSALTRLFNGVPVGAAMEYFDERYAELSSVLSAELEDIQFGKQADPHDLAGMWADSNDSRNLIVIGDPAVRLPVKQEAWESRIRYKR